jgi:hypothetical protein
MMEAAGMTAPVLAAEPQLAATLPDPAPEAGPVAPAAPSQSEEPAATSGEQA